MKRWTICLVGATLLMTGCATKKYVRQEVAGVNSRLDGVESQVEQAQTDIGETQEGLSAQGQRLDEQGRAIETTSKTAREALERAQQAGKLAEGKLLYEVALSEDQVRFAFDTTELTEESQAYLDQFAQQLISENKNVYIEIQGHTDSTGSETYNYKLGLDRAEAVRRLLNRSGIPLHRMSVISYGEAEPIADNGNREGRSKNRRVVLVVLE